MFWASILPSFFVFFCRWLPRPCWLEADVFLIGGMWAVIWWCTSTMERISPNLLGEIGFKWTVVRDHCVCDG